MNEMGLVKYTAATPRKRAALAKFEICVLSGITVNGSDATADVTATPELKEISGTHHFNIKPSATPSSGTFAGYPYYNIGLVKTKAHVAALSMISKCYF